MSKVSLIITVYNRVNLLRKCLISLSYQSVKPDELIISDDGSDENVLDGISDIIKNLSLPTKFVSQNHEGFRLAKCRNNGVRVAEGELLIFLDQDLFLTKNYIKTFTDHEKENRFLTSYPIRLSEEQSEGITEETIKNYTFMDILKKKQKDKIKNQYFKDYISFIGYNLGMVKQKPKLRGGVCAINKGDYYKVNGYDEKFNAWGNEDDDIRRRLYKAGISGFNPFYNEFPIHLYHEPFHQDGERANQDYVDERNKMIKSGNYECEFGVKTPLENKIEIIELN